MYGTSSNGKYSNFADNNLIGEKDLSPLMGRVNNINPYPSDTMPSMFHTYLRYSPTSYVHL